MLLLLESQRSGEPCSWVTRAESTFFPPDLSRGGVDLEALSVVFVPSAHAGASAACRLVRSGAFGLVVVDLGAQAELSLPVQGRLSSLALAHDAAVVLVTYKPASAPSLGSMISVRLQAQRTRLDESRFRIRLEALKDKRHGPGWIHEEVMHGPDGLR
jgi:recombination protein RecA